MVPATPRRPIRSFVLRAGRLTTGQARAFERLWPRYGLTLIPEQVLDLATVFGQSRPIRLEIGCGNGAALVELATAHPECGFIGVEVHRPGIGRLLLALEQRAITNIRILCQDALEVLAALPPASLEGVYLFFPDPWPKSRHHKRRIVQPAFVAALACVLRTSGWVQVATDWEDYAAWILAQFNACPALVNSATDGGYTIRPPQRPVTHFEQRGQRLGYPIRDLCFYRRD